MEHNGPKPDINFVRIRRELISDDGVTMGFADIAVDEVYSLVTGVASETIKKGRSKANKGANQ